jgi:hypothetical protein
VLADTIPTSETQKIALISEVIVGHSFVALLN